MRKRPRVVFAAVDLGRVTGGIAVLARLALESLVAMHDAGEIELSVQVLNESVPSGDFPPTELSRHVAIRWYAGSRLRFGAGVAFSGADLVLFDHVGPARSAALMPGPLRTPYAVFVHGVEVAEKSKASYVRTLRGAGMLIVNSEHTRKRIEALNGAMPDILVCRPGIAGTDRLHATAVDPILERIGPHAMLIVGRLDDAQRHKGHDQLIDCLPRILERVPDAKLVVAGGGGDRGRLEEKARTAGVSQSVLFTGYVEDAILHELYDHCALFAMPSSGDGFGFVFLEAMAHEKPCVGLASGAAAEIIDPGITGMLVDRDDPESMARSCSDLLLDRELRIKMGTAGREKLLRDFGKDRFSNCLSGAVRALLAAGGHPATEKRVGA